MWYQNIEIPTIIPMSYSEFLVFYASDMYRNATNGTTFILKVAVSTSTDVILFPPCIAKGG